MANLMKLTRLVIFILACILFAQSEVAAQAMTNEWKGYKPLRSTRAETDYCGLFQFGKRIDASGVLTSAFIYIPPSGPPRADGDSDEFLFSARCNDQDHFAKADLSETTDLVGLSHLLDGLKNNAGPRIARITFVGDFTLATGFEFGHLGWLSAQMKILRIVSVADVAGKKVEPDLSADAPFRKAFNSVKAANEWYVFTIMRENAADPKLAAILKRIKIYFNGKRLDYSELSDRLQTLRGQPTRNRFLVDKVRGRTWNVTGSIEVGTAMNDPAILYYENTFQVDREGVAEMIESKVRTH